MTLRATDGVRAGAAASQALRKLSLGYRLSQALYVVAELGVADLLSACPRSTEDLAAATGAHAPSLHRVLRLLVSEGVFAVRPDGLFEHTPLSEALRSDAPGSLRPRARVDASAGPWRAWGNLLHSVRTGSSAWDYTHGQPIFPYLAARPEEAALFNELMAAQSGPAGGAVAEAYDFSGVSTVMDVGGGYGSLVVALLRAHPHHRGVLFDQPAVVDAARDRIVAAGLDGRCEVLGGDFFDTVPDGADTYVLKHVLHDWDDAQCVAILRNCRAVLPPSGRVLVVEAVIPPGDEPSYSKYLDLQMLVWAEGRERTVGEYAALLGEADLVLARVISVDQDLSIIEAVPA